MPFIQLNLVRPKQKRADRKQSNKTRLIATHKTNDLEI